MEHLGNSLKSIVAGIPVLKKCWQFRSHLSLTCLVPTHIISTRSVLRMVISQMDVTNSPYMILMRVLAVKEEHRFMFTTMINLLLGNVTMV